MSGQAVASTQIDELLQLSRSETERQISGYRIFIFCVGMVLGLAVPVLTGTTEYSAFFVWLACTFYGLVLRQLVKKYGARQSIVLAGLIIDLSAAGAMFLIARHFSPPDVDQQDQIRWPTYVLPASLFTFLLINMLRANRLAAVVGAVWSSAVFFFVTVSFDGLQIQQVITACIFLATSWIGFRAAGRAREMLDRFARFQLLRRYLPTAAVERVLTDNPDTALALGGDLLTVTILAADLRNFTAMSEKLAPGEVVRQLNAYHGAMLEVIERHGGMLDKFIGDGTLVVFGLERVLPVKQKDSGAAAALACARDMLQALEKLNRSRMGANLPPLKMGIGIHTGPVVAGNIGAPGRRIEFTVVGDTVNTASRLEGLTKECNHPVVLSAATAALLDSKDGLAELDPMRVKGKDAPLTVFGLERAPENPLAPGRALPSA